MQNSHQTTVNTIVTSKKNHMTCKNSHQTTVNTIVTSQAQILSKWNYVTERSVQNIHEENYVSRELWLHNATSRNNPTNKTSENNVLV